MGTQVAGEISLPPRVPPGKYQLTQTISQQCQNSIPKPFEGRLDCLGAPLNATGRVACGKSAIGLTMLHQPLLLVGFGVSAERGGIISPSKAYGQNHPENTGSQPVSEAEQGLWLPLSTCQSVFEGDDEPPNKLIRCHQSVNGWMRGKLCFVH